MKPNKTIVIVSAALVLTACGTTQPKMEMTPDGKPLLAELGAPETPMEPMPLPALAQVGDSRIIYRNGEEQKVVIESVSEEGITSLVSDGCRFTDLVSDNNLPATSPSLNWENCSGGSAGYANVKVSNGLFPLEIGKKIVYTENGETTAGSWTGTWTNRRVCKVSEQVHIQTLSGKYDTWKITCTDKNNKREYYISPELGQVVAYKRKHHTDKAKNSTSIFLRNE